MVADSNADIRMIALGALAELGAIRAVDAIKNLLTDKSVPVRLEAATVLARFEDASGLPLVVRYLAEDGEHTRLAAAAYGKIVGRTFAPNAEGIAEARRCLDTQNA